MIGKHRVQIGDNTIRYDFVLSRNITIIRGDSGTGKTTLYNLIQEMNQKKNSDKQREFELFLLLSKKSKNQTDAI